MKKMTMVFALTLAVSLVFAAGVNEEYPLVSIEAEPVVAQPSEEVQLDDPSGKEVASIGVHGFLEGNLHNMNDEWYLECNGIMYELHMGIYGHNEPDMFLEGSPAMVSGFIYQHHVAPILVDTPQTSRHFWREDRFPQWSGGGSGKNQTEYPGERGAYDSVGIGQ